MPTIKLTSNVGLTITGASADDNATLNRYLKNPLSFITPAGFDAIAGQQMKDVRPDPFPFTMNAKAAGKFSVSTTSLGVNLGASASVGLLKGDDLADFLSSVIVPADPNLEGVVSFELGGSLSVSAGAAAGNFSFGSTAGATIALTGFHRSAAADTLSQAVEGAVKALTIPHDITDLNSLPENSICRARAESSLKFNASVAYDILNNPLATTALPGGMSVAVKATSGVELDASVTHKSGHTFTIAKLPGGLVHMAVSLDRIDDFKTSLTASAGLMAKVGNQDALAFLLGKISPKSADELKKIQTDLPPDKAKELADGIKNAIDATLSSSLQASLETALEDIESQKRLFLFEIDLAALDEDSRKALESALAGDFTELTRQGAVPAGIQLKRSALTKTSQITHSLVLHLLGIFNYGDINTFVGKSKIDYTKDTHEIVLSDESIKVVGNNLRAEKLREVVLKAMTLTLPASANAPEANTPVDVVFFDRHTDTSRSVIRQFANVCRAIGAPSAEAAGLLLTTQRKSYGTSSLYLGLDVSQAQCRQLFIDSGVPRDWAFYCRSVCSAQAIVLDGDADNADRLRLYQADINFWKALRDAGARDNVVTLLAERNIRANADTDFVTVNWWCASMEKYAKALARREPLDRVGKDVVRDATRGFDEPWLVLTTWEILGRPPMDSRFTCSLLGE